MEVQAQKHKSVASSSRVTCKQHLSKTNNPQWFIQLKRIGKVSQSNTSNQMDGRRRAPVTREPRTPDKNRDHPELFIPKKPSSANTNITPRGSANRLSGMYTPSQVNPSLHLNDSNSDSVDSRIATKAAQIPGAVAWVIELLMWNDQPKQKTVVKTSLIRQRVAAELQLPLHSFAQGHWKRNIRKLIDLEVVSMFLTPFLMAIFSNRSNC
jgi:hypothetical protein